MPFAKGISGNPGGRPKESAEVKRLARQHCEAAVAKLVELMSSSNESISLAAANALLDRGVGKPAQAITGDDEAPPIKVRGLIEFVTAMAVSGEAPVSD